MAGDQPRAINNAGLIVGVGGANRAVLWTGPGSMTLLTSLIVPPPPLPGVTLYEAAGISDSGFIACTGAPTGGPIPSQAYLLAPCTPAILIPPASIAIDHPSPVSFSITAVGAGPLTYQWRKGGAPLSNGPAPGGGTISGAVSSTLSISPATSADAGSYDCLITGSCGFGPSGPAILTVTCYANCDGSTAAPILNVNDFVCFQSRFAAGDSYANCDRSTTPPVLNVADFVCFQSRLAAGCP